MNSLEILNASPFNLSTKKAKEIIKQIDQMSLADQVGQLFFLLHFDMTAQGNMFDILKKYKPGGLMFRPTSQDVTETVIRFAEKEMAIMPFFSANIESGANALIAKENGYGSPMLLSATDDDQLVVQAVSDMASVSASAGANMTFSPVVDLQLNPDNPITQTRSFGDQVDQVIRMSEQFVKGFLQHQILPVIKHFPGDGVDNRDHHLLPSINSLSFPEWLATYGKIYKTLIDQGAPCIMAGHILLPDYDRTQFPNIEDHEIMPATLSSHLLQGLLRIQLGFNGLIITDASTMGGFNSFYPRKQAVVETIKAGCDMLLFTTDLAEDYQSIYQAAETGEISATRLNEALVRILGTKALLADKEKVALQPNKQDISSLKTAVFDKGITLVKNEIAFRKLEIEKHKKILLLDLHNGHSVSQQVIKRLTEAGFQVTKPEPDDVAFGLEAMMGSRQEMMKKYDLILYTLNYQVKSNQTTNRVSFGKPMGQFMPLFLKEIPTIMVSFGNPYHLEDAPRVPVYINAYSDQEGVVSATLDKLIGKSEFKGVSPVDAFCGRFDTRCY
ncbi:glycoside hydrolase family 3 protein [Lactococcus paracarnosus]|uniref:Glycoside hydrolase family 3 protein n=1 Tax=Pseudolactococcus paracarnosus TaxID=2749962 RepID=A0ABT0ALX9_9LACT|nr:glycoside hydrolase family 3 N-terminal domain-containing protein [Lactococcus paracarnosus]MCJ1977563.1 glycoside hydrolase family 3 protein [Lactococcus paracarnosus]MCJ1983706.1 glycoside hydrolase family 3 protein [Lactococcus paracarnosus]MCJ1998346.1 glycoside hydrolase family 3 protein [Lactococcus paracarnosus]